MTPEVIATYFQIGKP